MNTSQLPHAKPKPSKRAHPDAALDRRESEAVRARCNEQCEVVDYVIRVNEPTNPLARCQSNATQVHHMIGGRGKRGIGPSALREHKQAVCNSCHDDITGRIGGKKLIRVGGTVPLWTDPYRRIK